MMAATKVVCEINGSVWKIQVKVGDRINEDDSIAMLESMKMEIPVLAPTSGKVAAILVAEGDSVAEGQELMVIDE